MPPKVPGEFVVRFGVGRPLHDHADGLAELGAAAPVLLSCFEFVRAEVEGVAGCRDLVEGLRRLRGAVMAAASLRPVPAPPLPPVIVDDRDRYADRQEQCEDGEVR